MKIVKVALGSGWRNYGKEWTHVDKYSYDEVDVVDDASNLSKFEDNSVDVLYASHLLEYFNRDKAFDILHVWNRVLKPGGKLYISVPDFEMISRLYSDPMYSRKSPLHCFTGPLYGEMKVKDCGIESTIYHKTVYDFSALGELLKLVGFKRVEKYDTYDLIGEVDDHSKAKIDGDYISLNVVCTK